MPGKQLRSICLLHLAESKVFKGPVGGKWGVKDKAAVGRHRARLPPKVESHERAARTAWTGRGWTQAPWSETARWNNIIPSGRTDRGHHSITPQRDHTSPSHQVIVSTAGPPTALRCRASQEASFQNLSFKNYSCHFNWSRSLPWSNSADVFSISFWHHQKSTLILD